MTIIKKMAALLLCAAILSVFVGLRYDSSDRHYFLVDDLVVIKLVERARDQNLWQPHWNAAGKMLNPSERLQALAAETVNRSQNHYQYHYNFAGHITISSIIAVALKQLGLEPDSTVLLHAIALWWDFCSLVLLSWFAWRLLGWRAALITALCYTVLPLAVQSSHYARPDTLLGFQAMCVIAASYYLQRCRNNWQFFLLAAAIGVLLGVATVTKASSLLYGIFPLTIFIYCLVTRQRSFVELFISGIGLIVFTSLTIAIYFNVLDINWRDFIASIKTVQSYYQNPQAPDIRHDPSNVGHLIHLAKYMVGTLGVVWLSTAIIGALTIWRHAKALALLLCLPALALTVYYLTQSVFFDRSFLAIMPPLCLLTAYGTLTLVHCLPKSLKVTASIVLITLLLWPAAQISSQLQSHIGKTATDTRKAYQSELLAQWRQQTQIHLWVKHVDRMDIFQAKLPILKNPHPRLYIVEHFNDPQSDNYLAQLKQNGFKQVGYYRGDFAALPTNSLHIAHEAAHFYYFIKPDAIARFHSEGSEPLSK